jgi:hypothetical protein
MRLIMIIIEYEGHDVPKHDVSINPKSVDQPLRTKAGKLSQNGLFLKSIEDYKSGLFVKSIEDYKSGKSQPELVRVYEKLFAGVWSEKGFFKLRDYKVAESNDRKVFRFILEETEVDIDGSEVRENENRQRTRIIPGEVKKIVWGRDGGKCVLCGATNELHFDHDLPYSKGGTSISAYNVRILCARHNLKKSNKIE